MTIHRVAITYRPSALEEQQGQTESLVLPTVEVIADGAQQAVALAVMDNVDALKAAAATKPPGRWSVKVQGAF